MRTLEFKAEGQKLSKSGDFSGLVAGTAGYIQAHFECGLDWDKCVGKMAIFNDAVPVKLTKNNICVIPANVLACELFTVRLVGIGAEYKIRTNEIDIRQGR